MDRGLCGAQRHSGGEESCLSAKHVGYSCFLSDGGQAASAGEIWDPRGQKSDFVRRGRDWNRE